MNNIGITKTGKTRIKAKKRPYDKARWPNVLHCAAPTNINYFIKHILYVNTFWQAIMIPWEVDLLRDEEDYTVRDEQDYIVCVHAETFKNPSKIMHKVMSY